MENCDLDCLDSEPVCTGNNEGSNFSSILVDYYFVRLDFLQSKGLSFALKSTSWTLNDAEEGATCRLLCVNEDNLDVTATCSWNGKQYNNT